jgi:hypothetical protein
MPQAKDGAQPWTPVHLYKMQRLRRGSAVRRIVISVIALYAVLLQGMFAPPAAAFDSLGEITCAQNGSRSEAPGGEHHHHGLAAFLLALPVRASTSRRPRALSFFRCERLRALPLPSRQLT